MNRFSVTPDQAHALFASRYQQSAKVQFLDHGGGLPDQLISIGEAPGNGLEFLAIGRDQSCTGVLRIIITLRIDDQRNIRLLRQLDHALHVHQSALAVVGNDYHVMVRQQFCITIQQVLRAYFIRRRFKINPDKLLLLRHDAKLDGRF